MPVKSVVNVFAILGILLLPAFVERGDLDREIESLTEEIRDTQEVINFSEDIVDDPNETVWALLRHLWPGRT